MREVVTRIQVRRALIFGPIEPKLGVDHDDRTRHRQNRRLTGNNGRGGTRIDVFPKEPGVLSPVSPTEVRTLLRHAEAISSSAVRRSGEIDRVGSPQEVAGVNTGARPVYADGRL